MISVEAWTTIRYFNQFGIVQKMPKLYQPFWPMIQKSDPPGRSVRITSNSQVWHQIRYASLLSLSVKASLSYFLPRLKGGSANTKSIESLLIFGSNDKQSPWNNIPSWPEYMSFGGYLPFVLLLCISKFFIFPLIITLHSYPIKKSPFG